VGLAAAAAAATDRRETFPPALRLYVDGLRAHDVEKIAASVDDSLVFITPVRVMDKAQFLTFVAALYAGFPDWSYDHDEPATREDGSIGIRWRQGGTHTQPLALPGFPEVAATGRKVVIPEHFFFYRVAGGKVREIRPDPVPGGAPRGIFEQIGVALPPL